jgi:uncharacterized protein YecE (DUF72 family)
MRILAGTSGFSYTEWKGSFYPEDLPQKNFLPYYADRLGAVEINNTFYRMPSADVLAGWTAQVPEGFRFILKANRRITHFQRLKRSDDSVEYFLAQAAALGDRAGPVLYQLPPNMKCDVERLRGFLAALPAGHLAAFEFRHESWHDDAVFDALREHGAALCIASTDDGDTPFVATGGFGYLRLRRPEYAPGELAEWAARVQAQGWSDAYVFFKHEDEGAGPRLAAAFMEAAGAREAHGA